MKLDRRSFLKAAAVTLGSTSALLAEPLSPLSLGAETGLRIKLYVCDENGNPSPAAQSDADVTYLMDLDYDPIRRDLKATGNGNISSALPVGRFAIACHLVVTGFGPVWLFADNDGRGYHGDGRIREVFLNIDLASSRIAAATRYETLGIREGCTFSEEFRTELSQAKRILHEAISLSKSDQVGAARAAMASLCKAMYAGEQAAVERARNNIRNQGVRRGFLFGCNAFNYTDPQGEYEKHYREIFNFATLPFYWGGFEPKKGSPSWKQMDHSVAMLRDARITPKGHPLVYMHKDVVPQWLEDRSFENFYRLSEERVREVVGRYKDSILFWDVINEAHDYANALNLNHQQITELTRMACVTTKAANPRAMRIVNNADMWGEYTVNPGESKRTKWTPREYVQDMIGAGVPFEFTGVQMYYTDHDILEIDRLYDRLARLGKPLHITEAGISSGTGEDKSAMRSKVRSMWHAKWSEPTQAEFLEQFYTIGYGKRSVKAQSYWDFSDHNLHFWPYGGMLDAHNRPKLSFRGLKSLIDSWQNRV